MIITFMGYSGGPTMRKIEIIKQIRTITGLGLRESKGIADAICDGMAQEAESILPKKSDDLRTAINLLRDCGVNVKTDDAHSQAMGDIKEHVQSAMTTCIAHDEAELLEVLAVAFKMICEK